ncbi:MAG: efflux transporter outer membrane subunit, partial [Chlamydiales bacterium]
MVGPKYKAPEPQLPAQFDETQNEEASNADLRYWWEQFNDPVLDSLIAEALEANYDLRLAVEKIEQTRAQYRIEKSHLWPEIDFNASATRTRISQNLFPPPASSPAPSGSFFPVFLNMFQVGFDAIWELDFFGKFRHEKNAAFYTWEATKEDAQSILISMLSEVAVTYVNIRALQKKIQLAIKKIDADERELLITQDLFEVGLDNELQVMTLISTLETDRAALPVLESSFKQTVYALAYLLGRQPEGLIERFQESQPIPTSRDKVPIGLPADLLRRRPDVRMAERQLAAATEQIGSAIAGLFPHLSLTGLSFGSGPGSSIGLESFKLSKLLESASRMFSVGVNLNWDMLDFGKVRGQIDVQNSLQRQALLSYEQTVIGSLKDVESALVAYFEEEKRLNSFTLKVEADSRALEITRDLLKIGLANELQLLTAQKTLIDSQTSLTESEQSLAGDLIALYKALGGDWVG